MIAAAAGEWSERNQHFLINQRSRPSCQSSLFKCLTWRTAGWPPPPLSFEQHPPPVLLPLLLLFFWCCLKLFRNKSQLLPWFLFGSFVASQIHIQQSTTFRNLFWMLCPAIHIFVSASCFLSTTPLASVKKKLRTSVRSSQWCQQSGVFKAQECKNLIWSKLVIKLLLQYWIKGHPVCNSKCREVYRVQCECDVAVRLGVISFPDDMNVCVCVCQSLPSLIGGWEQTEPCSKNLCRAVECGWGQNMCFIRAGSVWESGQMYCRWMQVKLE